MKEIEFENAYVDLGHTFGWRAAGFRPARTKHGWVTAVKHDGKGWPDTTLVHPEFGIIFAEAKAQGGQPSQDQAEWLTVLDEACAAVRAGAPITTELWRPRDADEIAARLSNGRITEWRL